MIKSKITIGILAISAYLGLFLLFYVWPTPIEYLQELTKNGGFLAPLAYTSMAFLAVVIAPLTVIPFIPVASVLFGPFWAGVYTLIGWFLGSVLDFVIARKYGRPILKKLISMKQIEKLESYIPEHMEFWWIVMLRMIIPVDALSYALGLFSKVSLRKYALATLVSIAPGTFVISYAGEALLLNNLRTFIILAIIFVGVFLTLSYFFYKKGGVREDIQEEVVEEHKGRR